MSRASARNGRNSGESTAIWISNGNSLILIGVIADDTFCEDVEGSPKQDVVRWTANDVDLNVKSDFADSHGHIVHEP